MARTIPQVLHHRQPLSKLCWATCALMAREVILRKQNFDITPEKVYESMTYTSGNTAADFSMLVATLERWGVDAQLVDRKATFAEIQKEIDANRPLIVFLWGGSGVGHFIVIGGYEMQGPIRWLYVYDSLENGEQKMPFGALDSHIPAWNATFLLRARTV